MDINSKMLEDNKLIKNLYKFRFLKKIFNILFVISLGVIMIIVPNKKEAIIICLFLIMIKLILKNLKNEFKDIFVFLEINEIKNTCEDIVEIFEKTNDDSEIKCFLGKKHKAILDNLYKVEKYIYSSKLSGKKNENMLNELIVDVSKNLKIPVNDIIENIEQLDDNMDNKNIDLLDSLDNQSNLLKHNIEEVFELAKVVSGNIDLEIQKIDIKSLLKQGLIEYEERLKENNLIVKTNIEENKQYINADGQQMWRVIEILLDNICRYSKESSRVYINLYKEDNDIKISFINVSKDELNLDADKFLKLIRENSKENKMGLAIAYNLILIQHGEINLNIDGDVFKVNISFKEI